MDPSLGELEKSSIFKLALDKSSSVIGRLSELFSVNTPSNTLLPILLIEDIDKLLSIFCSSLSEVSCNVLILSGCLFLHDPPSCSICVKINE